MHNLSAPKQITWGICLVLYIIALLGHFGVVSLGPGFATYSWIFGYLLLLIASQIRNL